MAKKITRREFLAWLALVLIALLSRPVEYLAWILSGARQGFGSKSFGAGPYGR